MSKLENENVKLPNLNLVLTFALNPPTGRADLFHYSRSKKIVHTMLSKDCELAQLHRAI